jgi:hypothetical protein
LLEREREREWWWWRWFERNEMKLMRWGLGALM